MSAAQIYSQYISDYENAAKKYNREARSYGNTSDYQGGPLAVKSTDGQQLGLYNTPPVERNVVQRGTEADYQQAINSANEQQRQAFGGYIQDRDERGHGLETGSWSKQEAQSPDAYHAMGSIGGREGYYTDLGNGLSSMRTGGKGTGQYVTERIAGDETMAQTLAESGKFKDVKLVSAPSIDADGNSSGGQIDVTYEQMKFPDQPGEFNAKKPSLSMAQLREIANPDPTMAEAERNGIGDVGLIESARQKFMSAKPGLISSSR